MKSKRKIINDPVFGFINIPNDFLYDIIQHRYFQRLGRIKQLGVSSFVYPGAQHTRLQHSLGAMYLTSEAVKELRSKGHEISEDETSGVMAAILLHDVGHGPYSHVLENTIIQDVSHETISVMLMEKINSEMGGKLDLAIKIFKNQYHKKFLHQLVSSQLDMDRLDYLLRDSFFTGVVEGVIGSARIIKMLDIADDKLVVEQKGIHSIENYLMARRFMYWQVYLHKTSLATELMLIKILKRAKFLSSNGAEIFAAPSLQYFLNNDINANNFQNFPQILENFVNIDDSDIISAIKVWAQNSDKVLSILSKNFTERKLFKTKEIEFVTKEEKINFSRQYIDNLNVSESEAKYFFGQKTVQQNTYDVKTDGISVLFSDGSLKDISQVSNILNPTILSQDVKKNYLCYLKI
ncbi:MAG: HD domain-containing protein [Prevotellaceae bacterium]|nr:HD domain-containing protein [Prevotellaceae bacterium]